MTLQHLLHSCSSTLVALSRFKAAAVQAWWTNCSKLYASTCSVSCICSSLHSYCACPASVPVLPAQQHACCSSWHTLSHVASQLRSLCLLPVASLQHHIPHACIYEVSWQAECALRQGLQRARTLTDRHSGHSSCFGLLHCLFGLQQTAAIAVRVRSHCYQDQHCVCRQSLQAALLHKQVVLYMHGVLHNAMAAAF
jgi:hypothetical protein